MCVCTYIKLVIFLFNFFKNKLALENRGNGTFGANRSNQLVAPLFNHVVSIRVRSQKSVLM